MFYRLENHTPVEELDIVKWAKWYENTSNQVALTQLMDCTISTIFLGINHDFLGGGKPILFETMVFGGPQDGEQYRYHTWEEAENGHEDTVNKIIYQQEKE